jgi:hypothetical protein
MDNTLQYILAICQVLCKCFPNISFKPQPKKLYEVGFHSISILQVIKVETWDFDLPLDVHKLQGGR